MKKDGYSLLTVCTASSLCAKVLFFIVSMSKKFESKRRDLCIISVVFCEFSVSVMKNVGVHV